MTGVELVVGGWFASAIISKVVDKARSYIGDNLALNGSTEDMLNRMQAALPEIQSVINLAERQPILNPSLATWLRQLKDLVYEAEDLLDDLEAKRLRGDARGKSKVSNLASNSLKVVKHLFVSDEDIKNFRNTLKKLDGVAVGVGNFIQVISLDTEEAKQKIVDGGGETSSLLSDDILIGRDDEGEAILDMLLPNSNAELKFQAKQDAGGTSCGLGLRVLPLVGVGGVGKTALARLIYNHVDTSWEDHRFEDNHDLKKLTEQMIHNLAACSSLDEAAWDVERMKSSIPKSTSLDAVQVKLRNFLINKRFLIVLDNVWDDMGTVWDGLRSPLIHGADGSAILVTTQSRVTAEMMGTTVPIVLDVLEENDYWRLFERCAFGNKKAETAKFDELQTIGRQIAAKAHGLPLAAKALGRLLQLNLNRDHWTRVLESEWWELDFGLNQILPSLALSFQHLSANLKQCFAYCSIFPKGYIFEKDRLVQMWIAQGYIQTDERKRRRIEDIGAEWFDELTSRSFIQPTWSNRFIMHDLMRELAVYVSFEECLVLKDESRGIPEGIRHLSLRTDRLDLLIEEADKLRRLRTIMFFGDYDPEIFVNVLRCLFKKCRSLRVLDVSYSRVGIKSFPDGINGLSRLRYFDVSYTKFDYLPEAVCELFHLQVLNLQGCHFKRLPNNMNNLIKLRHLYADGDTMSLVHRIGKLTCLQEMAEFRVSSEKGHHIGELQHLNELRGELVIINLEKVDIADDAKKAKLIDKEYLQSLQLKWSSSESGGENILEALQPHCNLKDLIISGYSRVKSPNWMMAGLHLSNLQSIRLISCDKWKCLPPLGQIPSLKVLHIENVASIKQLDNQLYGNSDVIFPSLEELVLKDMDECEEWLEVEQGRELFPRLRKLFILHCRKLERFPLLSLKSSVVELVIWECGDLGSALPQCLQKLTSLSILEISSYKHDISVNLHNLSALEQLRLLNNPGLRFVDGLHSLRSLKLLQIIACPNLKLTSNPEKKRLYY